MIRPYIRAQVTLHGKLRLNAWQIKGHAMKMYIGLAFILFLTGCASTSTPSPQFKQASEQYATVGKSMNRDSVYRLLGPPQDEDSEGRLHWWIEEGDHRDELWLRFGPDGEMTEYERDVGRR